VCVDLPSRSAYCTYTLTDDERMINADDWQKMSVSRFSLSAQDFAKYQSFITEVCIKEKCSKDLKKSLKKFKRITSGVLREIH
jgi:hypothetical protein